MHNKYDQTKLIKTRKERGMKCIVPDTLRNDLRLETKLSSACRDIHKVFIISCITLPVNKLYTSIEKMHSYKNSDRVPDISRLQKQKNGFSNAG